MKAGIVGLPNVGKSTLFNCLSNAKAQSANFPFCTIEPNLGVVNVPDLRLEKLEELVVPERVLPATVEIVDIAGLVKGASKGEGLGNQFLANIRETDAILHVLRCFDNDNIIHVDNSIDPVRDKETIDIELQLKDLETVQKRLERVKRTAKTGNKEAQAELEVILKVESTLLEGKSVRAIEFSEKELIELNKLNNQEQDLPVTISSMIELVKLHGEDKIIMSSAGGSSAANLLGRFCHTDENINKHVTEIVKKEEVFYKDKIIAEIVHLPESRTGNILHRPVLRTFEIPYLAKSSVSKEFQLLPEDLLISVTQNRILLKSKSLNKEVIPRLSTAHNFSFNALPVYQFLCDMQTQDLKGGVGFNWGPLSGHYQFRPRVCYKNLIFSLASWNIEKQDFEKIIKIKDDTQLIKEVSDWRINLNIPDWVTLEEGDNELVIKLSNLLSVKTLISIVKKRPSFVLKEFLADEENMVVKNKEGVFTNEVILSFYRENN